ncbi:MAG: N-acetylmuramoyl-L-alanine amidase [Bacteroidales bacterium]|nr:N-acetylmuramoyl-L-alanine amidase [Bacteroidales bacterium]
MYKSFRTYLLLLCACLATSLFATGGGEKKMFTLVIDAGHGGHDAGACGKYGKEKNINLNVALAFGKLVEANCPDVKVVYTRKKDVFIPLQRRADIANSNKADLFISIHTNALPGGKIAYGSETYTLGIARAAANLEVAKRENSVITYESDYKTTYEGFDPSKAESYVIFEFMQDRYMKQSVELARQIQKNYAAAGRQNKGVHQAGFLVLRNTTMPAVLTELGFISTPQEENYLTSDRGVRELSRSIYNGFIAYRKQHDKAAAPMAPLPAEPKETAPARAKETPRAAEPIAQPVPAQPETKPDEKPGATPAPQDGEPQGQTPESVPDAAATPARNPGKAAESRPVFKVQILVSSTKLPAASPRFKKQSPIDCYRDGTLYKYTCGSSASYAEMRSKQKELSTLFPGCFIVAFLGGERIDLNAARNMAKGK